MELVDSEDMCPKNDALYRMGLVISIRFPVSLFRCQHLDKQMHEKEEKNETYSQKHLSIIGPGGKMLRFY